MAFCVAFQRSYQKVKRVYAFNLFSTSMHICVYVGARACLNLQWLMPDNIIFVTLVDTGICVGSTSTGLWQRCPIWYAEYTVGTSADSMPFCSMPD